MSVRSPVRRPVAQALRRAGGAQLSNKPWAGVLLVNADTGYVHPLLTYTRSGTIYLPQYDGTLAAAGPNVLQRSWDATSGWVFRFDPTWTQTVQNTNDPTVWSNAGCLTAAGQVGVNGALDGCAVRAAVGTGTSDPHYLSRPQVSTAGVPACASAVVKDLTGDLFFTLLFPTTAGFTVNVVCTFDLRSGTYTADGLVEAAGMERLANGYWRVWARATPTSTATGAIQFRLSSVYAATAQTFIGNGTSGFSVWNANITSTNYPTPVTVNGVGAATFSDPSLAGAAVPVSTLSFGVDYSLNALIDNGLVMSLSNGTFGESVYLNSLTVAASSQPSLNVVQGGVGQSTSAGLGPAAQIGVRRKVAARVAPNDMAVAWGGNLAVKDLSGTTPTVSNIILAANWSNNGNRPAVNIKRAWVSDQALPDNALIALSS